MGQPHKDAHERPRTGRLEIGSGSVVVWVRSLTMSVVQEPHKYSK